ncbi:hypothetical protein [Sodalis glossinidius]|uniref:hypothetical protein n=1 Tax=Sodalis glossinidius TaxID=63612 RepID=UPI0005A446E8|nr:hypothetical protein [Sodalis glossinidius]
MADMFISCPYIVYFSCIDPDDEYMTCDCIVEAITAIQATGQVKTYLKQIGFRKIKISKCHLATLYDIEKMNSLIDSYIGFRTEKDTLHQKRIL